MKFIDKKKFTKAILNKELKSFIIYILALEAPEITIYLLQIVLIISNNLMQITALK